MNLPSGLEHFTDLPEGTKHFVIAVSVSGIGITIHVAKKRTEDKEMILVGEVMELMMFMIIPAAAVFKMFQADIEVQPSYIILI